MLRVVESKINGVWIYEVQERVEGKHWKTLSCHNKKEYAESELKTLEKQVRLSL